MSNTKYCGAFQKSLLLFWFLMGTVPLPLTWPQSLFSANSVCHTGNSQLFRPIHSLKECAMRNKKVTEKLKF